ncbi:MAG: hypothetical protein M1834_008986 [Cirrosporium novae-zelandiae]|nr:MAG: hypothetical protein M1834_008986 [Cirrosporium novae-zelandiae]
MAQADAEVTKTSVNIGKVSDEEAVIQESPAQLDIAQGTVAETTNGDAGFSRSLKRRQIMMMAFGAGIGTGLWVGTGSALAKAGPGGIAISYTIMAYVVYVMYMAIGELTAYKPIHGGFIRQSQEYIDPAMGFAIGINFWFNWVMIIPAEVTAAISVLQFWPETNRVPIAGWITILLVVMVAINLFEVKWYGEWEFWLSLLKCIAIVAMIFFEIVMTSGGIPATNGPIEFKFWKNPGAFNNGIKGIAAAFVQAGFSFGGGEHIAVMAGEAADPRETVRKTVYPLFWRMASFFVVNIWLVGMCVPYTDPRLINESGTLASPFVIAIENAGLMPLAHVLNAFIFITVLSCGVTSVYIASRSLTNLCDLNLIPPWFNQKDSKGRPWSAMIISVALGGGLCYLNCNSTAEKVYSWFSSLVGISGFIQWGVILYSDVCFRAGLKAQKIDYRTLPFIDPWSPWDQWIGIAIVIFVLGLEFYLAVSPFDAEPSAANFFSTYIAAPLFVVDFYAYKWWYGTKFVKPEEMDFSAAKYWDELDVRLREEKEKEPVRKRSLWQKGVAAVVG